jgi:maspardin
MSNPLIDSRDAFAASYPEQRIDLNGREWGLVEVGSGPVLLLIPGTLGAAISSGNRSRHSRTGCASSP